MISGVGAPLRKASGTQRIGVLRRCKRAFEHGARGVIGAQPGMHAVQHIHLVDQLDAKRFFVSSNAHCHHSRRETCTDPDNPYRPHQYLRAHRGNQSYPGRQTSSHVYETDATQSSPLPQQW